MNVYSYICTKAWVNACMYKYICVCWWLFGYIVEQLESSMHGGGGVHLHIILI